MREMGLVGLRKPGLPHEVKRQRRKSSQRREEPGANNNMIDDEGTVDQGRGRRAT